MPGNRRLGRAASSVALPACAASAVRGQSRSGAASVLTGPLDVLPVGDSLTELLAVNCPQLAAWASTQQLTFVGPDTTDSFPHNGVSGSSTTDHLSTLSGVLATYHPHITVIGLGTNDGLNDLAYIPTFIARLEDLADIAYAARPAGVIVLASMMPNGAAGYGDKRAAFASAVNDLVTAQVGAGRKARFFDLYTPLAPFNAPDYSDSTHPTDAAYDALIEPLYRTMLAAAKAQFWS